MAHPDVNKYKSGVKNKERVVVTSENTDDSFSVSVLDGKNLRLMHHTFPGIKTDREIEVDREKK